LPEAQAKVWADTQRLIARIGRLASIEIGVLSDGIALLRKIRDETYEELNQIQHEHLILVAADWLIVEKRCDPKTEWFWNPRQTGDSTEPDLRGCLKGETLVSAEITTSKEPQGVIDKRMASTLNKLSRMQGKHFYFVRTEAMSSRARTKTSKAGWKIEVVRLSA